jgi:DNA-directed RNA polymerase I subunit RPA1
MTEGVNLRGCWTFGYGIVDLDRFTTNEIGDILTTYGVEAARTSIIQEMGGIFGAYGIGVDPRHLTVISDYMVRSSYRPDIQIVEINEMM